MDAPLLTPDSTSDAPGAFHAAHGYVPLNLERRVESGESSGLVGVGGLLDTVQLGDNCDVLGKLPRECVDLVVTSPPYDDLRTYGGHSWDFFGVAWQLVRVLKPGGVIVWVVADATKDGSESGTSMEQALHFRRLGLNIHDTMIYEKAGTGACGSNLAYWQTWEYAFVLSKGKPAAVHRLKAQNSSAGVKTTPRTVMKGNRDSDGARVVEDEGVRANIWRYNVNKYGMENTGHPAPFPIALAKDHIASWSNPGDLVLDPFAGSGTTLKAAKELNRHWLGIEINAAYLPIIHGRLAQDVLPLMGGGGAEPVREDADGTTREGHNEKLRDAGGKL